MNSYRNLASQKIADTLTTLSQRIGERFPGSGLLQVCRELIVMAEQTSERADKIARPNVPLIAGIWLLLLLAAGTALLVAPTWAATGWSWPLTPLTARAVGAWLVGLGWAAAHACLLDDTDRVRPLGLTGAAFVVLQVVALLRHGDAMDWSGWQVAAYGAGLARIGAVAVWILLLRGADAAAPGSSR